MSCTITKLEQQQPTGSIPHAELLKSATRRIVDRRVLHLIKMCLECPVVETDDRGRKTRTTEAKDTRRGIPQGSPLSPLLVNLYMRRFVLGWKKLGLEQRLGSRIVTYADDLVILCRKGRAEEALQRRRSAGRESRPPRTSRGPTPCRCLHSCSGCFRLERLPGGPCTHWKAPPFTAHTHGGQGRFQRADL
jgi:hypothetical protein